MEKARILKKNKSYFICILISALFHGVLLSLLNIANLKTYRPTDYSKPLRSPVLVELMDIQKLKSLPKDLKPIKSKKKKGKLQKKVESKSQITKLSFKKLSLGTGASVAYKFNRPDTAKLVGVFGDGTGTTSKIDHGGGSIFQYLYQYIGSNVEYPKIFRDKGIEGYVTVRVVFDKKGKYLQALSQIHSSSGYLKVLTSRTLKRIFQKPLPFDLSFVKHKYFLTDATFQFKASPDLDEDFVLANTFVSGRHLMFLIQKDSASMIGLRRNKEGTIKLGINYEEVYD